MINRSRARRTALVAGFVALSVVAASCGSDGNDDAVDDTVSEETGVDEVADTAVVDTTPEDDTTDDTLVDDTVVEEEVDEVTLTPEEEEQKANTQECVNELIPDEPDQGDASDDTTREAAHVLCNRFPDQVSDLTLTPCGEGFFPEIRRGEEIVFYTHGIIRFHPLNDPIDESNYQGGALHVPESGDLWSDVNASFHVIDDRGAHGAFVSSIIETMTGRQPARQELRDFATESDLASAINNVTPTDPATPAYLNLSLGTYLCPDDDGSGPGDFATKLPKLTEALTQLRVRFPDEGAITVVASAGNDGIGSDQLSWPAAFASEPDFIGMVESVGSISSDGVRSCFSNYAGVTAWAIGEDVTDGTTVWSGTSFAAPQITSLIAAGPLDAAHIAQPAEPNPEYTVSWTDGEGIEHESKTFCGEGTPYAYEFPAWMNAQYS